MRRFSVSLLAISFFIMSLCSCTADMPLKPVCYFTAEAQFVTDNTEFSAVVTSAQGQNIVIEVTSPDTLKGLTYTYTTDTLYIEYDGLKCTTNSDYLPADSPFQVIIDTLLSLSYSEPEYMKTDGNSSCYKGVSSSGEFTVYTESTTGFIQSVKPSYTDCQISFTEIIDTTNPT